MPEGITIHDVAAEAKVSIATVSRVLNNMSSVKDSTRERVYQAMQTVGYPLPDTQQTVQPDTKTILVMVSNVSNMFIGKEIEGIISTANYSGYDCVIFKRKSEVYDLEQICKVARSVNACGVLISWPNVPADIINKLAELYPVVQVNEYNESADVPYVSVDDYAIGKMAASYLLKLGYRKIGIMNGLNRFKYTRERFRGYQDALREFGLDPMPEYVYAFSSSKSEPVASLIVGADNPPEAVIATSDVQAAALISAVRAVGKTVPGDMAIISCEDTELAQYVYPPLTAVSQPIFHIGEEACNMLIDIMNGNSPSPNQICLKADLIVRGTT